MNVKNIIILILLFLILTNVSFNCFENFHDNKLQLKNVYGKELERCRKFDDDKRGGSWDNRGLCTEQGVKTGLHQICFGLNKDTSNFSKSTGQSDWSTERIIGRENNQNNHCMCLGAWSLYKARQKKNQIPITRNELKCRSIPDTAFLPEYVGKWNTWNGNEINNQVVDGMDQLVNQCIVDANDNDERSYLLKKYCDLTESRAEFHNFNYNLHCKKLIDLTNLDPNNNNNKDSFKIRAKYEKKIFEPMFLNPKSAVNASKSKSVHLSVPGLMPAYNDYWINSPNGNRNQIYYMPNDMKPHFHGDAPHHAAKFDIDKVWLMSKDGYKEVKDGKRIKEYREKPGIVRFNNGESNTPVEVWIHWRIPYNFKEYNIKEYPRLRVLKDSIIWWDFLSMHNLVLVDTEEEYKKNNFKDVLEISSGKKEKETLITIMDKPGVFYFACSIAGHAKQGHKIVIEVIDEKEKFTQHVNIDYLKKNGDKRIQKILKESHDNLINRIYSYCLNMRSDKSSGISKIDVFDKDGNNPIKFYVSSCCSSCYCQVLNKEFYYKENNGNFYLFRKNFGKPDKITQILQKKLPDNNVLPELKEKFVRESLCNM